MALQELGNVAAAGGDYNMNEASPKSPHITPSFPGAAGQDVNYVAAPHKTRGGWCHHKTFLVLAALAAALLWRRA